MRILLKKGKGLHSKYGWVAALIHVIQNEPALQNRIPIIIFNMKEGFYEASSLEKKDNIQFTNIRGKKAYYFLREFT